MTRRATFVALLCSLTTAAACADDSASASETSSSDTSGSPTTTVDTTATTIDPDTSAGPSTTADTTADGSTSTDASSSSGVDSSSSEGGTDTGGPVDPGEYVICDNDIPAAPDGAVCGVTPGTNTMLMRGMVLAGHRIYENGTVLVEGGQANGRILCAGCDCADEPEAAGATTIDCAEGVISPGLINPHDHISYALSQPVSHAGERYDHRHEWHIGQNGHDELEAFPGQDSSQEAILYGELRMVIGGATSIASSTQGDAEGLLRNLDNAGLTEGLTGVDSNYRTYPLGDSSGPYVVGDCDYPGIDATYNLQDDVYYAHIAEGVNDRANNEFLCMSGAPGGEELIVGNTSVVHGIAMLAEDVQTMAQANAELVWSARSNIDLYGITADIPTYRNLGIAIGLGTDWPVSGSMNMLRELRCADQFDTVHYGDIIPDLDLWLMATYWAALTQGAEDQIGLIRPGHIADIAIFDGSVHERHRAIIDAGVSDVALVMRGGQPLYGNASVIEGLVSPGELASCETIAALDQCGVDKRVCLELDTGLTLATMTAAIDPAAYELFFCGDPVDEPSCDPFRPMEFPARGGVEDGDGDGVADDDDNCPTIFNPIRPLDVDAQADGDGDGIGDSCDQCPLEDGENCTPPSLYDRDGDGVIDFDDNCPDAINAGQGDNDGDFLGDDCDACPDVANPGGVACPTSIYDIKEGIVPLDSMVTLADVLVTAAAPGEGFFVQVHPDDASYVGPEYSGLFVYHGDAGFSPMPGDRVSVSGTVEDFYGQIELVATIDASVESSGNADVPATPTTIAAIIEGGLDQAALEGVVVVIADVEVADLSPIGGPGDNNPVGEFEATGGLRVNDYFYAISPTPTLGQIYPFLTGVSRWANAYTKLEPRGPQDIPSSLLGFGPPLSYLLVGSNDVVPNPTLAVELSAIAMDDTAVALAYGNPAVLDGPAQVVVAAGESSALVALDGVAIGTASVTASYQGSDFDASVRVYSDAEARTPTLTPESLDLGSGVVAPLLLSLDLPAPAGGQAVNVSAAPGTAVMVPPVVIVPAGELSISFDVTAIGFGAEVVTADINGATDTTQVTVSDFPTFPDLVIVEAYYDHTSADDLYEWVKIYNGTAGAVDLSNYTLAWGGTDYTYGTLALEGVLPAGACFLVGGPNGDAVSGFAGPVSFDQAIDLDPDLQNSGATADGIALFDVAPGMIDAATVPVHAVIYGVANISGLLDETGAAGNVDIGDIADERSIRMNENGTWASNPNPTPTSCLPLP